MTRAILLRIVARRFPGLTCGPTSEVGVGLQVGKAHVDLVPGDAPGAVWETVVHLGRDEDAALVARGPAVHGPKGEKFLYLAWVGRTDGTVAMFRRAKLQLDGIPPTTLDAALASGGTLVATLPLTDHLGGPVCASVRPPRVAWTHVPST